MILHPQILARLLCVAHLRNGEKTPEQSRKCLDRFTDLEVDFIGLKGEYVASQEYGAPFDETGYGRAGDNGVDFVVPPGYAASGRGAIKTNHRRGGYLVIERWSDVAKVDFIHLVDGPCIPGRSCCCHDMPEMGPQDWRYIGWLSIADFKKKAKQTDWGLGTRFYCHQSELMKHIYKAALTPKYPVTFDPERHGYTHNGKEYEGCTSILRAEMFGYQGPNGDHTTRGSFLHDFNKAFCDHDLDEAWPLVTPKEWLGYCQALVRFYNEGHIFVVACEMPLVEPGWGYACTPDLIIALPDLGGDSPVEIKTGDTTDWQMQAAAQLYAWQCNFPERSISSSLQLLKLNADGTYREETANFGEALHDFAAILRVREMRRRRA